MVHWRNHRDWNKDIYVAKIPRYIDPCLFKLCRDASLCFFINDSVLSGSMLTQTTPCRDEKKPYESHTVVLVVQLVSRHSCVADRLPVVVRFPAGPRVRLKTVDPPKGNGLGQKKSRMSHTQRRSRGMFQIYADCLVNLVVIFLFVARVGLCCGFCDFAVSFLVPPDGPKNGTVKVLFFCSFTKLCMRSQKWDRQAVPFLGPCLGSFFAVFCIRVAEAQSFGFNETLWLMATGRATSEALLSEAGFEKIFRTQNWVRRSKLFCR